MFSIVRLLLQFWLFALVVCFCEIRTDKKSARCCAGGPQSLTAPELPEACSTFQCIPIDKFTRYTYDKIPKDMYSHDHIFYITQTEILGFGLDPFSLPDKNSGTIDTFAHCEDILVADPCLILKNWTITDTTCTGCFDISNFRHPEEASSAMPYKISEVGCITIDKIPDIQGLPPASPFVWPTPQTAGGSVNTPYPTPLYIPPTPRPTNATDLPIIMPPRDSPTTADSSSLVPILVGVIASILFLAMVAVLIVLILRKRAELTKPTESTLYEPNVLNDENNVDVMTSPKQTYSYPENNNNKDLKNAPQCLVCSNRYPTFDDLKHHCNKRHEGQGLPDSTYDSVPPIKKNSGQIGDYDVPPPPSKHNTENDLYGEAPPARINHPYKLGSNNGKKSSRRRKKSSRRRKSPTDLKDDTMDLAYVANPMNASASVVPNTIDLDYTASTPTSNVVENTEDLNYTAPPITITSQNNVTTKPIESSSSSSSNEDKPTIEIDMNETIPEHEAASSEEDYAGIEQSSVIELSEIEKEKVLGEGSFGVVYKATWRGIAVAVKEVKGMEGKEALLSEVRKMQNLRYHLNVVRFCGITRHPLSLVVEFCSGGSLEDKAKTLTLIEKRQVAQGIAAGINHLHLENVIHRDLAARNVLLHKQNGQIVAKVADFGMAREIDGDYQHTNSKVGPLKHMSPEQLVKLRYSRESDVWAYGVVLYELYSGHGPWKGLRPAVAAHKVLKGERLTIDREHWPQVMCDLMDWCWQTDPAARPTTKEIITALKDDT